MKCSCCCEAVSRELPLSNYRNGSICGNRKPARFGHCRKCPKAVNHSYNVGKAVMLDNTFAGFSGFLCHAYARALKKFI